MADYPSTSEPRDTDAIALQRFDPALLSLLDSIRPEALESRNYAQLVSDTKDSISRIIERHPESFIFVTGYIKECPSASFKQDFLFDVIYQLLHDGNSLSSLIEPYRGLTNVTTESEASWKQLATCLASVSDLAGNFMQLKRLPALAPQNLHKLLIERLCETIKNDPGLESKISATDLFRVQLLGRICISGGSQLVWQKFTYRALHEPNLATRQYMVKLLSIPIQYYDDSETAIHCQFDIFIERLYPPIFYHLRPTETSGDDIASLLQSHILEHGHLKHIICNKMLLQTNYKIEKRGQQILLFNIFSYLSRIVSAASVGNRRGATSSNIQSSQDDCSNDGKFTSLLIQTLLDVAASWANGTKMLLRSYEHNRYITTAFVIAFRHAAKFDKTGLSKHAGQVQKTLMQGIPIYLNCAVRELRDLAICLSETICPDLDRLAKSQLLVGAASAGASDNNKSDRKQNHRDNDPDGGNSLSFNVTLNDDCKDIKAAYTSDLKQLFGDFGDDDCKRSGDDAALTIDPNTVLVNDAKSDKQQCEVAVQLAGGRSQSTSKTNCASNERHRNLADGAPTRPPDHDAGKIKSANSSSDCCADNKTHCLTRDNLVLADASEDVRKSSRAGCDDDDDHNDDDVDDFVTSTSVDDESIKAPLYLSDCVRGLAENNNPRFVRLCLRKAGELISQLSANNDRCASATYTPRGGLASLRQEQDSRKMLAQTSFNDDKRKLMNGVAFVNTSLASLNHNNFVKQQQQQRQQQTRRTGRRRIQFIMHSATTSGSIATRPDQLATTTTTTTNRRQFVNDAISDTAIELAQTLLQLDDQFHIDNFVELRMKALSLLCIAQPSLVVKYLLDEFNAANRLSTRQKLDILEILVGSAEHLSESRVGNDKSRELAGLKLENGEHSTCGAKVNKFVEYGPMYFYGLAQYLRVDIEAATMSPASIQPTSILAAIKQQQQSSSSPTHRLGSSRNSARATKDLFNNLMVGIEQTKTGLNIDGLNIGCRQARVVALSDDDELDDDDESAHANSKGYGLVRHSGSSGASHGDDKVANKSCMTGAAESPKYSSDDPHHNERRRSAGPPAVSESSESNKHEMDDSYLLCRILFSISLIIKCLSQQPITCKLSNDLIDILAAYKFHPDLGVRQAMVVCLKIIRDSTPKVYYDENLKDKTMHLFGNWLVRIINDD